jgi:hypothetical protein
MWEARGLCELSKAVVGREGKGFCFSSLYIPKRFRGFENPLPRTKEAGEKLCFVSGHDLSRDRTRLRLRRAMESA